MPARRSAVSAGGLRIIHPEDQKWLKFLVFSPGGHGKTRLVGTAQMDERTAPILLLDYEGGTQTLAGLEPAVDVIRIRAFGEYWDVLDFLRSDSADNIYRSVAVDSVSEAHFGDILEILHDTAGKRTDPDRIDQSDYSKAGTQIKRMMQDYKDLPLHVLMTCGSRLYEEPGEGMVAKLALSSGLADDCHRIMDVVGYLAKTIVAGQPLTRTLLLENQKSFRTKARLPWLSAPVEFIDDPTMTKLLDALGY